MKVVTEATANLIVEDSEYTGFELFGYDFMVDTDLNVWLIEVNQNPCLSTLSQKQEVLINNLIADVLR
jgi:tubulin monoglycylase TTLL3/8